MKGYVQDIEAVATHNEDFQKVLDTAEHCQLVVMAPKPNEEIGAGVHKLDQFFRVEQGSDEAVLDGVRTTVRAGEGPASDRPLRSPGNRPALTDAGDPWGRSATS